MVGTTDLHMTPHQVAFASMLRAVRGETTDSDIERMSDVVKDAPCDTCESKCKACYNGLQCTAYDRWVEMARYTASWEKSWEYFERDKGVVHKTKPRRGFMVTYRDVKKKPDTRHISTIHKKRYSN